MMLCSVRCVYKLKYVVDLFIHAEEVVRNGLSMEIEVLEKELKQKELLPPIRKMSDKIFREVERWEIARSFYQIHSKQQLTNLIYLLREKKNECQRNMLYILLVYTIFLPFFFCFNTHKA